MKGSPILRAIFMIAPLLLLAWPLAQVIATPDHADQASAPTKKSEKRGYRSDLTLKTTHPFREVSFKAGDSTTVWKSGESDKEIVLPITKSGLLCELKVVWKGRPEHAALSLEIVPDFLEKKEITFWSDNESSSTKTQLIQWKIPGDE